MTDRLSDDTISKNVDLWGSSFADHRRCYSYISHSRTKRYRIYCKVQHLGSKKISVSLYDNLKKGKSPFYNKEKDIEMVKRDITEMGLKHGFVIKKIKRTKHLTYSKICIYFPLLKKTFIANYPSLRLGYLPLSFTNLIYEEKIFKKIKILGLKNKQKEKFKPLKIKRINGRCKVLVQSLHSNKKVWVYSYSLIKNKNPFRIEYDYDEKLRVHPLIKNFLKKLKIKYHHEFHIKNKQKVDFVLYLKNKMIALEIKSDNKSWSKKELKKQLEKYEQSNIFDKVLLCSPNGRYGLSLKQLKEYLNQFV